MKSVRDGTWLSQIYAPLANILEAIFYWSSELEWPKITKWTSLSRKQIWKISRACRLVAANFMLENPDLTKIGGLDKKGRPIYVQADETHCGKMKYHKGATRVPTWVLGAVEMPADTDPPQAAPKFWAMTVPNRKKATLIPIFKFKIKEESIIWTDGWSAYFCLKGHFKDWDYVNHSRGFKDPRTGVNTNRCEGGWKWLKQTIPDGRHLDKRWRSMSNSTTSSSGSKITEI